VAGSLSKNLDQWRYFTMARASMPVTLKGVPPLGQRFGFWVFLLTGTALFGFDPETDGMDGIKALVRKRFPAVQQLPTRELAAWLNDTNRPPPLLLDVRQPEEYAVSHLAGARRVDPAAKPDLVKSLAPTNRPVVVYCSVGYRSSELAQRLIKAGVTNVFNLEGSIFQWANEDRPLVNEQGAAARVHPYNERWGALLKPAVRDNAK
jgi:rhodanese-related sulfurtransferase